MGDEDSPREVAWQALANNVFSDRDQAANASATRDPVPDRQLTSYDSTRVHSNASQPLDPPPHL